MQHLGSVAQMSRCQRGGGWVEGCPPGGSNSQAGCEQGVGPDPASQLNMRPGHPDPSHTPHSLPNQYVVLLFPAVLQGGVDQALSDAAGVGRPPHLDLQAGGSGGGGRARSTMRRAPRCISACLSP